MLAVSIVHVWSRLLTVGQLGNCLQLVFVANERSKLALTPVNDSCLRRCSGKGKIAISLTEGSSVC